MAGVAEWHDPDALDALALGQPSQRLLEHVAVVDARDEHDLDVQVDAGIEQLVEARERAVVAGADERAPHLLVHRVQGHVERRQPLLGDARDVGSR